MTRFVWGRSFVVSFLFVAIVATLLWSFLRTIDQQLELRSIDMAREIGEDIRLQVESHVQALRVVTAVSHESWVTNDHAYRDAAASVIASYPGFYGINLVDPEGYVRKVYPHEGNSVALGRMNPRTADLRAYSRDHLVAVMTSRLKTLQGVDAFVIYIPYQQNGKFVGWVAGILDLQGWMSRYLAGKTSEGVSVRVLFGFDVKSGYDYGPPFDASSQSVGQTQAQILNQNVTIEVGVHDMNEFLPRWWLSVSVVAFGGLVSILLTVLTTSQQNSLRRLTLAHRSLAVKNSLVSSLTHDLGTPLTVLSLSIDRIDRDGKIDPKAWARLKKSSATLRTMLESVRLFHAADLGRLRLEMKPINLAEVTREALDETRELAERKGIQIVNTIHAEVGFVIADRSTFTYNVLPNLLTNAIKFSRPGGKIEIEAEALRQSIVLRVIDHGVGIPQSDLRAFVEEGKRIDTDPLPGEKGSGVGLLQVRTFMELYRGNFAIESKTAHDIGPGADAGAATGTRVTLTFRRGVGES